MVEDNDAEWLASTAGTIPSVVMEEVARLMDVPDRAAVLEIVQHPGAEPLRFWRKAYLQQLVDNGVVSPGAPVGELVESAGSLPRAYRHEMYTSDAWDRPVRKARAGTVLMVSVFGIQKFGGAEHFLEQMAHLYKEFGYDPIIVGTRSDRVGETGSFNGLRYAFIAANPAALFRLAHSEKAVIAHVVSGLGYEVGAALRYLDTKLVFGIHFWRELFHPTTSNAGYYPDCPKGHEPRAEFQLLLTDFDAVYANSIFTREVIEQTFGTRLNVIPSLPDDLQAGRPLPEEGRSIVLLANCRYDKGYDLVLQVASRLPDIQFVVIASQSGIDAAMAAKVAAGVENVLIRDRCEDMSELYDISTVVLVPSFEFVETFSRVVIEAQRFGIPVIGSDSGNVPYLLRESGVSLPYDPDLWAAEIRRLCGEPAYWTLRSEAALRNSDTFAFTQQKQRLSMLVEGMSSSFLLGVGSGIGNIIHTTPLIRNIARHLGARIDVVVAGDSKAALAVVANSDYVNHIYALTDVPVRRQYQTVFLTHSFGTLVPPFRATRIIRSRSWDRFHAGHHLHEAEFNLAAAEALLQIPYEADDVSQAFMADLRRSSGSTDLVGFHAGSKTGAWAAKRWPYFSELAAALNARGLRVASFGSADEYVPGTLDLTGGSVEEMAARMIDCGAFVSNDSGVMNIANALGIPLVAIFGPTEARTRGPLGQTSFSVTLRKSCAPCELAGHSGPFFQGSCRCIGDIPTGIVEQAVLDVMAGHQEHTAPNAASVHTILDDVT